MGNVKTTLRVGLRAGLVLALAGSWLGGCSLLLPLAFLGNPKQTVLAEFAKLTGRKTLVLISADPSTLFDYPHVQLELATYIGDRLKREVRGVQLIDPVRVVDYQERRMNRAQDPEALGHEFGAEMVVYIELLRFQIRDPEAPDLLRADIEGSVSVYDLRADPDETEVYPLEPVEITYPKGGGTLFTPSKSIQVRQAAYDMFAEKVAGKFYEHEEEL